MPSGGDWEKLARRCVVRAMSHEDAEQYFSEPVDAVADGLPDYLDVIDQPMDLGTVLEKLDNRKVRGRRCAGSPRPERRRDAPKRPFR